MGPNSVEPTTEMKELIFVPSELVENKADQSRLLSIPRKQSIASVLRNCKRTASLENLRPSEGKKKFPNRDRNTLPLLVKPNRRLNFQDITSKLN